MSNDTEKQSGRKPDLHAFQTREGTEKDYFNRIGAAWAHKDGEGFNLQLDALPVDGKVVLRTPQERLQEAKDNARGGQNEGRREEKRSSGREDRREAGPRYER